VDLAASQDAIRAHRRTVALLGAVLVTPFMVVDLAAGAGARVVGARACWGLSLLACAALLRPGSRVAPGWADAIAAAGSTAASIALVWWTGGVASGYFGFLSALPFCIAVLLPGAIVWSTVSGIITTVAGIAMLLASPVPQLEALRWIATAVTLGFLAAIATRLARSLLARRIEAEQARAAMAERLAENARHLAETQQLAMAGRLAAGVAHEVNNPLAYLKANLGWFRERLAELGAGDDPQLAEALQDAELGVDRIARIVADLRDASHRPTEQPCRARVAEVVGEARRSASVRTAHVDVRVTLAPDLPDVRMCRGRVVQVLVNLLVNAADALAGTRGEAAWIALSAEARDGGVLLAVEDGGPGFPPALLPRALDPFVTTKAPGHGMGLGLALSREYVGAASGQIRAANVPGGGARVEVWLPAAEPDDEPRCLLCEYRPGEPAAVEPDSPGCRPMPRRRGAA
jgi:two-component system, NtrC family, sensor kinase